MARSSCGTSHSHSLLGQLNNHAGAIASLAFSPDGRSLAAADIRGTVVLWDVQSRRPLGVPLQTHHLVNSVAYSPDGRTLAAGNGDNGTVGLWDVQSHHLIRTLRIGNRGPVNSVVFAPHTPILATGSETGTVQLWSLPGDKPLATLTGGTGPVFSVAFSPDGRTLAAGGFNGTINCGGELRNATETRPRPLFVNTRRRLVEKRKHARLSQKNRGCESVANRRAAGIGVEARGCAKNGRRRGEVCAGRDGEWPPFGGICHSLAAICRTASRRKDPCPNVGHIGDDAVAGADPEPHQAGPSTRDLLTKLAEAELDRLARLRVSHDRAAIGILVAGT